MAKKKVTENVEVKEKKKKTKELAVPELVRLELSREVIEERKGTWPEKDDSVDEISILYMIEYLDPEDRINFVNEAHRVLKKDAKAVIISTMWSTNRAYSDLAMQWPPVAEGWFFHLRKEWRTINNKYEKRYTCDFETTWGYKLHPLIEPRNQEYQQNAVVFWKEATQDIIATLVKL